MATSVNLGRVVGYSAYEIAVQNGYEGTEEQWLNSLKGADGAPGATGPAGETGPAGADGADGSDGFSPVATVARNQADDGVVISITDANGTTTATVYDGEDGSGGIPTDPDEEYTNVLSGAGIWANAWDVARQGAYARANIITFETKVLETPSPITVYLNNFPSYYLTDTIQISWAYYREGEGSGGDGFPMELASHTQQQTGETWTYTEENGNITLVFVNDWSSANPWTITITNPDWTYTGVDYLSGLAVEHDNFADAVNEVVDTGGSAPTYTAGTGIDITNNVISSTVVVPTATSDLTNDSGFITSSALSGYAQTSDLATVATTGDYSDLSNTPTIPTVPTNVSSFTNDAGYITASQVPNELPSYSSASEGDVLTVDSRGELNWATPSSGSVPTDPDLNPNNVLTGDGSFANAWDTAINASYKTVVIEDEGVIDRNDISFETTEDFPDWGDVNPLNLLVDGLDGNSEAISIDEQLDWDGNGSYSSADYELSKTDDGEGNYTYTISCLNGNDFVSASYFEIGFDAFGDVMNGFKTDIPDAPQADGYYTLQVDNGTVSWVSTPIGGSF